MKPLKRCPVCGETKAVTAFSPDNATSNGLRAYCKACNAARAAEWRNRNPERVGEWQRKNKERHCQIVMAHQKRNPGSAHKWQKANPKLAAECTERWRAKNVEHRRAYERAHRRANLAQDCAKVARRAAQKLRAVPSWANHFFIEEIYDLARRRNLTTGIKWQVDHIVPLLSKRVCGLHVEDNLAVIPAVINWKKGARYWPESKAKGNPMEMYEGKNALVDS